MTAPDPDTSAETIFDQLWDTRLARVDQQLERIANTAYWLGRKLAKHEITKDDVDRRLKALCAPKPIDDPAWCPYDMAEAHAVAGLARGMGTT